jgi:adenosylcobyric acid synthase
LLGLCGGYQILGRRIADPEGIEGPPSETLGLGLLDVETVLRGSKRLASVTGRTIADGVAFHGYEMHMGETTGPDTRHPLVQRADTRMEGATSADGRVMGSYVHGFFQHDAQRAAWLARFGVAVIPKNYAASIERVLDTWAAHLETHCDIAAILAVAASGRPAAA